LFVDGGSLMGVLLGLAPLVVYWYFVSTDRTLFHSMFAPGTDILLSHIERTAQVYKVKGAYMVHSNVDLDSRQLQYLLSHFGSPDYFWVRSINHPLMVRAIQFVAEDNGTCAPRISDEVIVRSIGMPVKFTYNNEKRWEGYDFLFSERPLAIVEFVVAASMIRFDEFKVERFALLVFATLLLVLPRSIDALVDCVIHTACATTCWVGKLLLSWTGSLARGALGCGKFALRAVESTVFFVMNVAAALAVGAAYVVGLPARALALSLNASARGSVAALRKANRAKTSAAQFPYRRFDLEVVAQCCSEREAAEGASAVDTAKCAAADQISAVKQPSVENPSVDPGLDGTAQPSAVESSSSSSSKVRQASRSKRCKYSPQERVALAKQLCEIDKARSCTTHAADEMKKARPRVAAAVAVRRRGVATPRVAAAAAAAEPKVQANKTWPAKPKRPSAKTGSSSSTTVPSAVPRRSHRLVTKH
jgi:hypothetical protein